jgi:hypothetical protein
LSAESIEFVEVMEFVGFMEKQFVSMAVERLPSIEYLALAERRLQETQ